MFNLSVWYSSKQSEYGIWIYENGLSYDMAYVTTVTGWLKLLESNFRNFKWFSCPSFYMFLVYNDRKFIFNGLIKGIFVSVSCWICVKCTKTFACSFFFKEKKNENVTSSKELKLHLIVTVKIPPHRNSDNFNSSKAWEFNLIEQWRFRMLARPNEIYRFLRGSY